MLSIEELGNRIPKFSNQTDEYKFAIYKRYTDYINYSELPSAFQTDNINTSALPKNIKVLYDNIATIIDENHSFIFRFNDYEYTHNISTMLINEYFVKVILNDMTMKHILYIDTNLIMEDYKKMMDITDSEDSVRTNHKLITLNKNIEEADIVIWDKCTMLKSSYEKSKFYDILSIRYRKGLGNLFFVKGSTMELSSLFDKETFVVMNTEEIVDCSREQVLINTDNKKGSIKW